MSYSRRYLCGPVPAFVVVGNIITIIRLGDAEDTLHTARPATIYQWQHPQYNQFISYMGHASHSINIVYQLYQTVVMTALQ